MVREGTETFINQDDLLGALEFRNSILSQRPGDDSREEDEKAANFRDDVEDFEEEIKRSERTTIVGNTQQELPQNFEEDDNLEFTMKKDSL